MSRWSFSGAGTTVSRWGMSKPEMLGLVVLAVATTSTLQADRRIVGATLALPSLFPLAPLT